MDRSSLRIAIRTLGKHRGFTTVAILSLAAAIALNTTMYSVLDAMFASHISARLPDNVYELRYFGGYRRPLASSSVDMALENNLRGLESISGFRFLNYVGTIAENGTAFRHVSPYVVRTNFFDLLGTPPQQGRTFLPADEAEASAVVISDWLSEQIFPNESPVGRSIVVAGGSYNVIGVVERNQRYEPLSTDVWILRPARAMPVAVSIARFRDKIDERVVFAGLQVVAAQLALSVGLKPGETGFRLLKYKVGQFRIPGLTWALIAAVIAVLIVACANLANLQLARGLARARELALRSAVGASRRQLILHLVQESGLLATVGLSLGVLLTLGGIKLAKASIPPVMVEYIITPQMSWRVLVFAAFAAVVCLFLIGLLPALHVSRVDPNAMLKSGAGTGANKEHRRRYGLMVIAQIGFTLPVLIGGIVLLQHMWTVYTQPFRWLSFDPTQVVSARIPINAKATAKLPLLRMAEQLTTSAMLVRDVENAAVYTLSIPPGRIVSADQADGTIKEVAANSWAYRIVSPSYYRTIGRSMAKGRDFEGAEGDSRSVIIDQGTALFLFGRSNPIGRVIKLGVEKSREPWLRVVGVVGDKLDSATLVNSDYMFGRRVSEIARVVTSADLVSLKEGRGALNLYARVKGNTDLVAARLGRSLRSVEGAEESRAEPLAQEYFITQTRTRQSFIASLFSTFAFIGLVLVAIGVYGIVSHSVAERRREIAVRISLGATAQNILHAVLREGNALILAGIALGLLLTKYGVLWLGGFIDDPYDAMVFALIATLLFGIAAFAGFVPAWRATRIDPVEALRSE